MRKRLASAALTLVMLLTLLPTSAFAAGSVTVSPTSGIIYAGTDSNSTTVLVASDFPIQSVEWTILSGSEAAAIRQDKIFQTYYAHGILTAKDTVSKDTEVLVQAKVSFVNGGSQTVTAEKAVTVSTALSGRPGGSTGGSTGGSGNAGSTPYGSFPYLSGSDTVDRDEYVSFWIGLSDPTLNPGVSMSDLEYRWTTSNRNVVGFGSLENPKSEVTSDPAYSGNGVRLYFPGSGTATLSLDLYYKGGYVQSLGSKTYTVTGTGMSLTLSTGGKSDFESGDTVSLSVTTSGSQPAGYEWQVLQFLPQGGATSAPEVTPTSADSSTATWVCPSVTEKTGYRFICSPKNSVGWAQDTLAKMIDITVSPKASTPPANVGVAFTTGSMGTDKVTSISFKNAADSSIQLNAEFSGADMFTTYSVKWTVEDSDIALLAETASGSKQSSITQRWSVSNACYLRVFPMSAGSTKVKVEIMSGSTVVGTGSIDVTVGGTSGSTGSISNRYFAVSTGSATMTTDEAIQINAEITNSRGAPFFGWYVDNPDIVLISDSKNGIRRPNVLERGITDYCDTRGIHVFPQKPGTATISADLVRLDSEGYITLGTPLKITITVTGNGGENPGTPPEIKLDKTSLNLAVQDRFDYISAGKATADYDIKWTVADTSIAYLHKAVPHGTAPLVKSCTTSLADGDDTHRIGIQLEGKTGSTTITVQAVKNGVNWGSPITIPVTVNDGKNPTLRLDETKVTMKVGESKQIIYTLSGDWRGAGWTFSYKIEDWSLLGWTGGGNLSDFTRPNSYYDMFKASKPGTTRIKFYFCEKDDWTKEIEGTAQYCDVTIEPAEGPEAYTVSFNANGGSGSMAAVNNVSGTYTLPANGFTAPAGKRFKGWATSANGAVISGTTISVSANTTLYAIWENIPAVTYTVSFNANGGKGSMAEVKNVSGTYTLPANGFTAPAGKRFKGWATSADGAVISGTTISVSANTTLYAIWENIPAVSYTVSFNANGGKGSMAEVKNVSGTYTLPANGFTAPTGKRFKGWATSANGAVISGSRITISANTTLYAIWETVSTSGYYTITFDANGGDVSPTTRTTDASGYLSSLPTPTRYRYRFDGWYTRSSGGSRVTSSWRFDDDTTIYAQWTYTGGSSGSTGGGSSGSSGSTGTRKPATSSPTKKPAVTVTPTPAAPVPEKTSGFRDVPSGAYYSAAVEWAVSKGVTSGMSDGSFNPNASCTRAQTVTFLWRAAGSPAPKSTTNPFTDVKAGSYYYNAVLWAVENGITGGTTQATFSPDATVTRGQTVTFLYRASNSPSVSGSNPFSDVAADTYYADAVQWAVNKGVTSGASDTLFNPNGVCTRAQIVTFLYRNSGV